LQEPDGTSTTSVGGGNLKLPRSSSDKYDPEEAIEISVRDGWKCIVIVSANIETRSRKLLFGLNRDQSYR
jgi:hypothetical protein